VCADSQPHVCRHVNAEILRRSRCPRFGSVSARAFCEGRRSGRRTLTICGCHRFTPCRAGTSPSDALTTSLNSRHERVPCPRDGSAGTGADRHRSASVGSPVSSVAATTLPSGRNRSAAAPLQQDWCRSHLMASDIPRIPFPPPCALRRSQAGQEFASSCSPPSHAEVRCQLLATVISPSATRG